MKIALLAPSGAGKTAFLAGLYGVLTEDLSHSNYGINFEIRDKKLNSYLGERYTNLLKNHDFGEGSKERRHYPFTLTTRGPNGEARNMDVEIVDFPGGFLHSATDDNVKEVEETIKRLSECDGFIVMLDGEKLIEGIESNNPRILQHSTRANDIQNVLAGALERRKKRIARGLPDPNGYAFGAGLTPVVFALTKGDMVETWLAKDPDGKGEQLRSGIGTQFRRVNGTYQEDEGSIANFMRAHFGQILNHENVCSLRTTVTVYDEVKKNMDPRNLDTVFQFVLFMGLRNACTEYVERTEKWNEEQADRRRRFNQERRAYERAVSARAEFEDLDWFGRVGKWLDGEGRDFHNSRVSSWHSDMESAGENLNESSLSVKQVQENHATAKLLYERVLSDELMARLVYAQGQASFYHQGLPLDELMKEPWFKRKVEATAEWARQVFEAGTP